jgi:amidase
MDCCGPAEAPCLPQEPWTAGHETMVAEGPKGLRIGGIICYDGISCIVCLTHRCPDKCFAVDHHIRGAHAVPCSGDFPEIVRDCVFKGAELVIRIQGYMHPCNEQQRIISQVRAFESNVYFAVANMAGEVRHSASR